MRRELEELKVIFRNPKPTAGYWKAVAVSVLVGLLLFTWLRGAKNAELCSMAVSEDGSCFAYLQDDVEGGDEATMLRCLTTDGQFRYAVNLTAYSAGGSGVVWYEGENLCVFLYREDCTRVYSPQGTLLEVRSSETYPDDQIPGFDSDVCERTYAGAEFKLVYSRSGFFAWFFLSNPRKLTLYPSGGDSVILWSADRQNGITVAVGAAEAP